MPDAGAPLASRSATEGGVSGRRLTRLSRVVTGNENYVKASSAFYQYPASDGEVYWRVSRWYDKVACRMAERPRRHIVDTVGARCVGLVNSSV